MRIAIRGRRSLDDIRRILGESLDRLERMGVSHAVGTNFYLNPCDEEGEQFVIMVKGEEVGGWDFPAPKKAKPAMAPADTTANVVPFTRK